MLLLRHINRAVVLWRGAEVSVSSAEGKVMLRERHSGRVLLNPTDPELCNSHASLSQSRPEGSLTLRASSPATSLPMLPLASSRVADAPVYTAADIVTSSRGKTLVLPTSDVGGSSQPETSEESTDSFYETTILNSEMPKCWYFPPGTKPTIHCLDDGFSLPHWSRTEHELELKEKLRVKYDARGVLLGEKDAEIARLKSLVKEKETESAEVLRLRDPRRNTDISLLDSRASYLKSALDDSQAACDEARNLISSLSSERDGLASEVSTLHSAFSDFKEKMEAQQEERAQELKCQEGLAAGHEHGIAGTPLSAVVAYNPETAKNNYLDARSCMFLLDGPLATLPEAAHLQPCLEQLSVPIYHADVNAVAGETSLSFALLNVHTRAEGAKKHAAALRQLMVDIVSHPLSSQNLLGQASTSVVISCVEDLDTDEDLGSVVCMPQFEDPRFEILP
ncbi:hypothetical protein Tco_0730183 [Tanacetum coccineum]|uniref:Uncharacterized protein n=1 Tax=Tanacetum coccineum TaxID=301880 RepID=A0ABQ4YTT5_9ASTR